MATEKILVPTDFTHVSDIAIEHAKAVAMATESEVYVIHIVEHKKSLNEARLKLNALKERVKETLDLDVEVVGRIGNIYEDIDSAAVEMDACSYYHGNSWNAGNAIYYWE